MYRTAAWRRAQDKQPYFGHQLWSRGWDIGNTLGRNAVLRVTVTWDRREAWVGLRYRWADENPFVLLFWLNLLPCVQIGVTVHFAESSDGA